VTPAGRALRVAAAAAMLVGATAGPAAAHVIGGGAEPTNYRTSVRGFQPAVPGLEARTVAPGDRLELVNRTGQEVLVLGYRLEPYLRVGPDGAFENRRSPSAYANRFATPPASTPAEFDATAAPEWRRIGDRPTVAWRDHRARWTAADPQAVTAAPDRRHVVMPNWQVPMRLGERTLLLEGDVTWVPGPSPWPWVLAALAALALALAAARGPRRPRVLALVALLAVAADVVHTVGAVLASDAPLSAELNGTVTTVAGWAVAGLAAYRLLRGRAESAAVFLLLGGVLLTLAGALPDLAALGRSQVPTAVGAAVTRAAIAATLGLGTAMVVAGLVGSGVRRGGRGDPKGVSRSNGSRSTGPPAPA
jgi:hypothetical protein